MSLMQTIALPDPARNLLAQALLCGSVHPTLDDLGRLILKLSQENTPISPYLVPLIADIIISGEDAPRDEFFRAISSDGSSPPPPFIEALLRVQKQIGILNRNPKEIFLNDQETGSGRGAVVKIEAADSLHYKFSKKNIQGGGLVVCVSGESPGSDKLPETSICRYDTHSKISGALNALVAELPQAAEVAFYILHSGTVDIEVGSLVTKVLSTKGIFDPQRFLVASLAEKEIHINLNCWPGKLQRGQHLVGPEEEYI